jgi:hypothetical protein
MKKTILIIATLFIGTFVSAQSIVATSGDTYENGTASLSWTMGEPVVDTYENQDAQLTQGFQQPTYTIVGIYERENLDISIKAYPNPAVDYVNILVTDSKSEKRTIHLLDASGKLIANYVMTESKQKVDLSHLPVSNYLLIVSDTNGEMLKTFKVQKIN